MSIDATHRGRVIGEVVRDKQLKWWALSHQDSQKSPRQKSPRSVSRSSYPQIALPQSGATDRRLPPGSCSLPLDQWLPSPRPSGRSLVVIGPGIGLPGPIAFMGVEGRLRSPKREQQPRERRSCELTSGKSMPKSRVCVPGLPPSTTTSMNAAGGILNILGRGLRYDGGSPLSGIACSVASRTLLSRAGVRAGDHEDPSSCCRSALSPARASGTPVASNIASRRPIGLRMHPPASRR